MSSIKSKASRQKPRRWSFAITCADKGFHIPVVCFGPASKANEIAQRIHEDYSNGVEALKDLAFKVEKIPHETISLATQQQFEGLEFEGKLLSKALELVYDNFSPNTESDEDKRKVLGGFVVKAKAALLKEYYPDGAGTAINESIDREIAAIEEEYKMPLGAQAVQEVLNGSTEN